MGHADRQPYYQMLTGETTTDIMNNIYNFEGNNSEWTVTAISKYGRAHRGGCFAHRYEAAPVIAETSPMADRCYYGTRSILYVK